MAIGLHVYYLRTYEHAGVVDVYLCGKRIGEIDALTNDYKKFHISMPALTTINIDSKVKCYNKLFGNSRPPKNEEYKLQFVHKYKLSNQENPHFNKQRKTQKVKLLSIQICRMG